MSMAAQHRRGRGGRVVLLFVLLWLQGFKHGCAEGRLQLLSHCCILSQLCKWHNEVLKQQFLNNRQVQVRANDLLCAYLQWMLSAVLLSA
jgi:hypothetical protein